MQEQLVFHLTGKVNGAGLEPIEGLALRPALFARFRDLTRLRYDFPVVLVDGAAADACLETLSGLMDSLLEKTAAPGIAGERLRRNGLRLEREIRTLVAGGARGRLSELWSRAAGGAVSSGGEPAATDLALLRGALMVDGEVLDCDPVMPARLVAHVWRALTDARTRAARAQIDTLTVRLGDLLDADLLRSVEGRGPAALRASVGPRHEALFDFEAMAGLLAKPSGHRGLPEQRRRRIEEALGVLRGQRFFAAADHRYEYAFERVEDALAAYRERLPAMVRLVKAIAIAELEAHGRYLEETHDDYFRGFDAGAIGTQDLARFPDYLVRSDAADRAPIMDALASGVPLKILVETRDIVGDGGGSLSLGAQLARSAMGLDDVFVVQASSASLWRVRGRLVRAMAHAGPALVSVFSADGGSGVPPYLAAAAATQSRAFPSFSYDPGAGPDLAARFSLEENPQPLEAWPVHELAYADGALQRKSEVVPFTVIDFLAADPRHGRHFARVPRERWNGGMLPVGEWLEGPPEGGPEQVPFVYAVDAGDALQRLVVDAKLVAAARHCAEGWRRLQELESLKRKPEPVVVADAAPVEAATVAAPPGSAPAAATAETAPVEEARPDDPYIETPRCTTCNECTQVNSAMFAYNDNKQAYIKDLSAGTYAQLVEAAENCQVAIIHPGKPRDPKEPGLAELVKRAEPFL